MKISAIFIFLTTLQLTANSYSQSLNVNIKNGSLSDVFQTIETQTDYTIFYKDNHVNSDLPVNLKVKEGNVNKVLDLALEGSNIRYSIIDKIIVLLPKKNADQGITVNGKITDVNGNPLPGVNIIEKGTTNGAVTNLDGDYTISVSSPNTILSFSYVGFLTEEIEVDGKTTINLTMVEDIQSLEEVVVIGYTSTTRKNVASSVSSIKSEEITGLSTSDARQMLQGKMAGVQVVNNNGTPGAGARVIIRGIGSFSNPDPLYIIDGIQGGDFNSITPQDIESITVLKDAATTAIYGSAAANGVVIITTKSGKKGEFKVEYDGSIGLASFNKRYDMLKASDYVDLLADIQAAGGLELTEKLKSDYVRVDRTDWQEEIFRNAMVTDHSIRLSGGTDNVTYAFSTGYQNHESTVIDRNFQRLTLGAKISERLFNDRVRLGQHIRIRNDVIKGQLASLGGTLNMAPYIPIYDSTNLGGYARSDKVTDLSENGNPFNTVYNTDSEFRTFNSDIELTGEVNLFDGLKFKSQARLGVMNYHSTEFDYPSYQFALNPTASINEAYRFRYSAFVENFIEYNNTLGDHQLSAVLGNSWDPSDIYRSISVGGSDYTSDAIQNVALANSNSITGAAVNGGRSRLSYFGRVGYTFKNRYVFNVTGRRDATSVFGSENRWGTFYGLGAAWTISDEEFMIPITAISNLKLRLSYGETGNDNIPPFLTEQTVWKGTSNNIVYSFGDNTDYAYGSTINSVPNPLLKWEETQQYNVGLDLGLFNNELNFVVDYYKRANNDLLIETTLPGSTGLGLAGQSARQWVNAASMENTGFEFVVMYSSYDSKTFKWDVSLNATYSINEVTALGTIGDIPVTAGGWEVGIGNSTRTDIGHPLGSFYGYIVDHVAKDQAEVDMLNAAAVEATNGEIAEYSASLLPGDFVFKDVDRNGYVDTEDRTYIGNPSPTWQYGGVFNASYSNFDFQLQFYGIADVDVVNGVKYYTEGMWRPNNSTTNALRRWKQDGDVTDVPAAGQNSGTNLAFSDWYVEKGDYLKIRNITLGYTLPESIFNKAFTRMRVYVSAQNVLTLTNYSGYDPEISTYTSDNETYIFSRGIDEYQRPNPTIYRFGVQINF